MGEYDRSIATAKRLIAKKGISVPWTRIATVALDPSKPWEVTTTEVTENVKIVFLPFNLQTWQTLSKMKDSEVPASACIGYMAPVNFTPDLMGSVLFDGQVLKLYHMDVIKPNGTPVLYTLGFGS